MNRHILSLSHEQLTSFDLEAFVTQAEALNQHHRETFTSHSAPFSVLLRPFSKSPQ